MRHRTRTDIIERAIHQLTFAREVSMDANRVRTLLDALGAWSRAHSDRNGERSQAAIRKAVDQASTRLEAVVTHQPVSAHQVLSQQRSKTEHG